MSLSRVKSFIIWLTQSSKNFSKPTQSECVIFDQVGYVALKEVIPIRIKRSILHTRNESLYLNPKTILLLLNYLRKGYSLDLAYFASQIRQAQPKVVLTFIDNRPAFHELSNMFPSIRFIAIQNGNRFPYAEGCLPTETTYQSEILLWNDCEMDHCADLGITFKRIYIAGSLRNELARVTLSPQPKFDICLISNFIPGEKNKIWVQESNILGIWLNNFLLSDLSLKACVALRNCSDKGSPLAEEVKHFREVLGDRVVLIPNDEPFSSYFASDASTVTLSVGSSLSIETLGRGNKSLIVHPIRTSESSRESECRLNFFVNQEVDFTRRLWELLNLRDEEFGSLYAQEIAYLSHASSSPNVNETLERILWKTMELSDAKLCRHPS